MLFSLLSEFAMMTGNQNLIYKLQRDIFKSVGKNEKDYLGPAPAEDMIDDPDIENTLMIQGDFSKVVPQIQENHQVHIQKHMNLLQSPSLAQIPSHLLGEITQFAQQHIQQHMQMMQMVMSMMQKGQKNGPPGEQPGEGSKSRNSGQLQGPNSQPGMEQVPGPLGQALDSKRSGEGGGNTEIPRQ
jgi:hypothetical protein